MATYRVTWKRRVPIGDTGREELRTLVQTFGASHKAADFACDILYMLGVLEITGHSDKWYLVNKSKPRVEWQSRWQNEWVTVEYLGVQGYALKPVHTLQNADRAIGLLWAEHGYNRILVSAMADGASSRLPLVW